MGLFDWKKNKKSAEEEAKNELAALSGMRVEVSDREDGLLFEGRLGVSWSGNAELQQLTAFEAEPGQEMPVKLRGYQTASKQAVHLDAEIIAAKEGVWQIRNVKVVSKDNDRAGFRQELTADGDVMPFRRDSVYSNPCKVLNVSVGGVCIRMAEEYEVGDKLLLKSRLLDGMELTPMLCVVRRVTKLKNGFEYGCEFEDLDPATEETISKAIVAMQMKRARRE